MRTMTRLARLVAALGLAVHLDLDHGLAALAAGRPLADDAEALQLEEGLVLPQGLAHQEVEAAVGALELVAVLLQLLEPRQDLGDHRAVAVQGGVEPA